MTDPQAGTGPETITEAELAEALTERLRRCGGSYLVISATSEAAAEIFEEARRNREPEYEPGGIYEDSVGARYLRRHGRSLLQWVRIFPDGAVQERHHDAPVRPLRKLVPEGKLHAAVVRMIHSYRDRAVADPSWPYWKDIAADLEKLLEGSDD